MTTPPEIARKVRQLDHDVQTYQMLAGISATQQRQGNRLEEIATRQADLATGQAEHGTKLDAILDLLHGSPAADGR